MSHRPIRMEGRDRRPSPSPPPVPPVRAALSPSSRPIPSHSREDTSLPPFPIRVEGVTSPPFPLGRGKGHTRARCPSPRCPRPFPFPLDRRPVREGTPPPAPLPIRAEGGVQGHTAPYAQEGCTRGYATPGPFPICAEEVRTRGTPPPLPVATRPSPSPALYARVRHPPPFRVGRGAHRIPPPLPFPDRTATYAQEGGTRGRAIPGPKGGVRGHATPPRLCGRANGGVPSPFHLAAPPVRAERGHVRGRRTRVECTRARCPVHAGRGTGVTPPPVSSSLSPSPFDHAALYVRERGAQGHATPGPTRPVRAEGARRPLPLGGAAPYARGVHKGTEGRPVATGPSPSPFDRAALYARERGAEGHATPGPTRLVRAEGARTRGTTPLFPLAVPPRTRGEGARGGTPSPTPPHSRARGVHEGTEGHPIATGPSPSPFDRAALYARERGAQGYATPGPLPVRAEGARTRGTTPLFPLAAPPHTRGEGARKGKPPHSCGKGRTRLPASLRVAGAGMVSARPRPSRLHAVFVRHWLAWTLGTEVLPFDADIFGIAKTVEVLAMYYTEEVAPLGEYYIFSSSSSALQAVHNPCNCTAQKHALMFHQLLSTLYLRHANVQFYLVWTPVDGDSEGQQFARHTATKACKCDPPEGLDRVQSVAYQKDRARWHAFQQWEAKWYADSLIPEFRRCNLGEDTVSHHHHVLITSPPAHDKHHPLWLATTDMERNQHGKKTKTPKFTWRTTSTAMQVATDHTFTGTYSQRFRPLDLLEHTSYPCGTPLRTTEHVMLHCPWFDQAHISFAIRSSAWNLVRPLLPYHTLFLSRGGAEKLCKFLQFTRTLSCPDPGLLPPPVPPEPD
ncbi:hypothetical protein EDB85DRAFT_2246783 [Lactarius pseudohatsudake]|nr:hypothetical protein EDB85DRAFT_2246783 [Lactarius pseudohatsudake]